MYPLTAAALHKMFMISDTEVLNTIIGSGPLLCQYKLALSKTNRGSYSGTSTQNVLGLIQDCTTVYRNVHAGSITAVESKLCYSITLAPKVTAVNQRKQPILVH